MIYYNVLQTRRDIVYLISSYQNHGNSAKTVFDTNDEFTVSEVHRPKNAIFIEKVLIENVVSHHKKFHMSKKSEINFMVDCQNNKTSKIIEVYLNDYNNQAGIESKSKKVELENEKNYSNSPLQKTEKNEKEIEKYRKLRSRDGENYNKIQENDDDNKSKNCEENDEKLHRNEDFYGYNNFHTTSVSLPIFLVSVSFFSFLSFLYGRNQFSK